MLVKVFLMIFSELIFSTDIINGSYHFSLEQKRVSNFYFLSPFTFVPL